MGNAQKLLVDFALLYACSTQYSPGSSNWTPANNAPHLNCSDVTTPPTEIKVSPVEGEIVQVTYRVEKREKKYWCYESVELRTSKEEVPELLNWVQVRIGQDRDGSATLDLKAKHDTSPTLRDDIRISKDAILALYLLNPVLQTLDITFTLKFQTRSALQVNVTVESAGILEKSLTLGIPDLNLVSKVGLRTRAEEGTDRNLVPDKNCTDKIQVLQMCSEELGKDYTSWYIVAAVIGVVFSVCVVGVILWRIGHLQRYLSGITSHILPLQPFWTRVPSNLV